MDVFSTSASSGQPRSLMSHEKNTGTRPCFSTQSLQPAAHPGDSVEYGSATVMVDLKFASN